MRHNKHRDIIESIPNEGCLIVFNAPYLITRRRINHYGCGMLSVHVFTTAWTSPEENDAEVRDLYIRWREE